jgi:hypothetical protein
MSSSSWGPTGRYKNKVIPYFYSNVILKVICKLDDKALDKLMIHLNGNFQGILREINYLCSCGNGSAPAVRRPILFHAGEKIMPHRCPQNFFNSAHFYEIATPRKTTSGACDDTIKDLCNRAGKGIYQGDTEIP